MPIKAEPIEQTKLDTVDELSDWINDTQKNLKRIPIVGLLENRAIFHDDEYLGDFETMFRFNDHSIRAFCQRLGFRFDQLVLLETPTLATQVVNDLLQQTAIRGKLSGDEFVFDERTNTIVGIVSRTYLGYSNDQFLSDVASFLAQNNAEDAFQFHQAYAINTELTIRYCSEVRHGAFDGPLGKGEDKTRLGLEFKNSMVGTSSVQINYFLYRLICSNGMMVPAARSMNRVFHSGKKDSFKARLSQSFREVVRSLDSVHQLLMTLGTMPFNPEMLAANDSVSERLFDIIPACKQTICDKENLRLRFPPESTEANRRDLRLRHDTNLIELIPIHFGGEIAGSVFRSRRRSHATLFDFLNVFTEYAKECVPAQRLAIEERAGDLAKYIAENAKKF
jgi:hypothetical protein